MCSPISLHHSSPHESCDTNNPDALQSNLSKDSDGSFTVYIQDEEPTDSNQATNWLPSPPDAGYYLVLRLYEPQEAALYGEYEPPVIDTMQ